MNTTINQVKDDTLEIAYKGKKYKINITSELEINPGLINKQLEVAPSNYAFLCLVRDKYIFKRDKLERLRSITYSQVWTYYKESGNISNDLADNKATTHSKYISICERLDILNYKVNKLISICKAYETRERILQTLSAYLRKL